MWFHYCKIVIRSWYPFKCLIGHRNSSGKVISEAQSCALLAYLDTMTNDVGHVLHHWYDIGIILLPYYFENLKHSCKLFSVMSAILSKSLYKLKLIKSQYLQWKSKLIVSFLTGKKHYSYIHSPCQQNTFMKIWF